MVQNRVPQTGNRQTGQAYSIYSIRPGLLQYANWLQTYCMNRFTRLTILLTLSKASGVALLGGILILNLFSRKTSNDTIEKESTYPLEINGVSYVITASSSSMYSF